MKFYCSCRIDVRRIGQLKEGEDVVGQRVRAKVVKNKVAPPFRVAEFDMMHANGISYEGDVLDLALAQKLIVRSGAWFRYGDLHLGQGREKTRAYLQENPALVEELKNKIMAAGAQPLATAGDEAATPADDAEVMRAGPIRCSTEAWQLGMTVAEGSHDASATHRLQ